MRLTIGNPCGEDWDAMEVQGRGRHCASCDHLVVDFSRMTREKAEAFVEARAGRRICGRLLVDPATREAWFPPSEARAPRWRGGLVLAAALTGAGCSAERTAETEVAAIAEPAVAPMEPLDPVTFASVVVPVTRPVPAVELSAPEATVAPTEEQRRLTRQKHRAPASAVSPPPHLYPMMGDVAF